MVSAPIQTARQGLERESAMTRAITLVAATIFLTGCQLYWTKPGADLTSFTADHRACATKAGVPMDGDRVLVNESLYKACLKGLGWTRESASRQEGAAGHFRGLEEDAVVSLSELPEQVGRASARPGDPSPERPTWLDIRCRQLTERERQVTNRECLGR
jgi:hypothetical protein